MALLVTAFVATFASAVALDVPSIYGSHQVFQAGKPVQLWGTDTSSSVTATFQGQNFTSAVNAAGVWRITLPAQQEGTPPTSISLTSSPSGETLQLVDVAFGDVIVCGGQSNMQLSVLATVNQSATAAASGSFAQYLRLFQVALVAGYVNTTTPQTNVTSSIPWSRAGPDNVLGMSAMCYFYGVNLVSAHPGTYVGVIDSSWGGTAIEVWMSGEALTSCGEPPVDGQEYAVTRGDTPAVAAYTGVHKYVPDPALPLPLSAVNPSKPSCLYDAMIAPLLPLAVRNFQWYQGEANAGNPTGYERCFPGLIAQWRADWVNGTGGSNDPEAPFLFAQLAGYPDGDTGVLPTQRYAQQAALALPNVGMVVTGDVSDPSGSFHPIHPPWKAEVARRAFLWADAVVYGNASSPTSGPRPLSVTVDPYDVSWGLYHYGIQSGVCQAGTGFLCLGMRVKFDQPLVQRPLFGSLTGQYNGFDLVGSVNNASQPVTLTGVRTDDPTVLQLNVTWVNGGVPATLYYGWDDYPTLPLANAFGLPVAPFNMSVPRGAAGPTTRAYPAYYSTLRGE